jgi:hypothetical protein
LIASSGSNPGNEDDTPDTGAQPTGAGFSTTRRIARPEGIDMTDNLDDYVLRNMHRATVLADIVRRLGETPAAQALLDERATLRKTIATCATDILLAAGARYADQPDLCADLGAARTETISAAGWETQLFGLTRLNTQLWRPLIATLRTPCWRNIISLTIEPAHGEPSTRPELRAYAPILDFSVAQRAMRGNFRSLPVASLSSALHLSRAGLPPLLRDSRIAIENALESIDKITLSLAALYNDLPALAEATLQPRQTPTQAYSGAASSILSAL